MNNSNDKDSRTPARNLDQPEPFMELVRDSYPLFSSQWKLTVGGPALYFYGPLLVVGVPVFIFALLIGFIILLINKGLYWLAMFPIGVVGVLLYALAVNWIRVSWTAIALKLLRAEPADFAELLKSSPKFINFFLTTFIIGVATVLGGICFIVPGVFIAIRTAFAPFLVVDEDLGPIEALFKSNELVQGYSWQVLGALVLLYLVNTVAGLIPLAHLLVTPASYGYFDLIIGRMYLWQRAALSERRADSEHNYH